LAKCINNAKSQQCKRLSKINNENAYQILAINKWTIYQPIMLYFLCSRMSR